MWLQSLVSELNPQQAFLLGCALAFIGLIAIIIFNVKKYKELEKRYAHATNDNDFLCAEMSLTVSTAGPEAMQAMRNTSMYKNALAQYLLNKRYIERTGRRP